jgi:hypothetical protein
MSRHCYGKRSLKSEEFNMGVQPESNHRILTISAAAELLNMSPELLQLMGIADLGATVIEWRDKNCLRTS